MARIYKYAIGSTRTLDNAPTNTSANTTILSSIRLNGETDFTIYSGGTTDNKFVDYLKTALIPTLNKGNVVIIDNMRTHHVKGVKQAIEEVFKVKVASVNTVTVRPKDRRVGRYTGLTNRSKKAIVTLAEGQTIDLG